MESSRTGYLFIVLILIGLAGSARANPVSADQQVAVKKALQSLKGTMGRLKVDPVDQIHGRDMRLIRDALDVLDRLGYDPFKWSEDRCGSVTLPLASGAQLASIENSFAQTQSEGSRLLVLELATRTHRFSIRQARRLASSFMDQQLRADALIMLHSTLAKPTQFHQLLELVADSKQVRRIVEETRPPKAQ